MNIRDSGARTEFDTGAVRDVQEGKGRMDLLPMRALIEIGVSTRHATTNTYTHALSAGLNSIANYMSNPSKRSSHLAHGCWFMLCALSMDTLNHNCTCGSLSIVTIPPTALIEVAKIFEAGAVKYSPRNWENGIPLSRFIDSGIRHVMKHIRGDDDEPHLAMACWNFMCCLDTLCRIRDGILPPDLNDLPVYTKHQQEDDLEALKNLR